MMGERALIPGYVKLPPSTVGIGGPLVPFPPSSGAFIKGLSLSSTKPCNTSRP
jgi:hypothetical protein